MRYIGGKSLMIDNINNVIEQNNVNVDSVIDIFSGSGVVAANFKNNGYQTISNDYLYFSYVLQKTAIGLSARPRFGKSYKDGYEIPMGHADEIIRYIDENKQRKTSLNPNEWWKVFDDNVDKFNFAFISSRFKGTFRDRLDYISKRFGVNGAAISSVNLLLLAEDIKSGRLSLGDAFDKFECNDEILL